MGNDIKHLRKLKKQFLAKHNGFIYNVSLLINSINNYFETGNICVTNAWSVKLQTNKTQK